MRRRSLLFGDDIPSHDTLTDVVNALDPELFKSCFMDWVPTVHDVIKGMSTTSRAYWVSRKVELSDAYPV